MAGFADTDEGREACKLALMELAEAFGVPDGVLDPLMPIAMEGRLYLKDGKVAYILAKPFKLKNEEKFDRVELREPEAPDYMAYSNGMTINVNRATEMASFDPVFVFKRTMKAVSVLSGEGVGIVDRFSVRDIRTLGEVCDALGFFE